MHPKFQFISTGDPHLCIDVQCPAGRHPETFFDEQRAKLKFIREYAKENSIHALTIPGDLLNYKNPSVYTANSINSLIGELKQLKEDIGTAYSISGNHDLKMSSREMKAKSVYNIFAQSGLLYDIANQTVSVAEGVTLSGIDYNHDKSDLMREVSELNERLSHSNTNILVLHEHLLPTGESLPFGQHINYDEFLQFQNIDIIVSGHLHKGYPTVTIEAVDIDSDEESHKITFVNPWSLTRVARDHYALSEEHTPELVHVSIYEDKRVEFKHVVIPHVSFDKAFIKDSLVSEESLEIDISEFVSSLNDFNMDETPMDKINLSDKSDKVKERIQHYLQLAEVQE